MTDSLNTAQAYIDAGNFASARALITDALARDPNNLEASLLLITLEQRSTGPEAALDLTARFIPQWPDVPQLRMQRLMALEAMERPETMRSDIERLRTDFPYLPEAYLYWSGVYEVRFGSAVIAAHHLEQLRRYDGNSGYARSLDSMIATSNADFFANERIVRSYLEDGYSDAGTLAELSLCEFFTLKIAAARRTSQAALSQNPREPTAQAVRLLSLLVWFPPFFFAHLCMLPSGTEAPERSGLVTVFLAWLDFWLIALLMSALGALALFPSIWTGAGILALFVGWMMWPRLINRVLSLYGRRAKHIVRVDLKDF